MPRALLAPLAAPLLGLAPVLAGPPEVAAVVPVDGQADGQADAAPDAATAWVELPDAPAAKAWAGVGPETAPASFGDAALFARLEGGSAWDAPETWDDWSARLASSSDGTREDAAAVRAALALLALEQGRNEDAWRHFAACADAPAWLARILPRFLPGVPVARVPESGGRPPRLPEGARLSPAIPSLPPNDSGVLLAREATVRDLSVGAARLDLRVVFDSYGVQLDLEWRGGGAASLELVIPEPDGFETRIEYVDWLRQEGTGLPRRVELSEESPQASLFAKIQPVQAPWPTAVDVVPSELAAAGLWIEHEPADPELETLRAVARAAERVIGHAVGLRERADAGARPTEAAPVGIVLRLPAPGPERRRKLAWLAAALERFALGTR